MKPTISCAAIGEGNLLLCCLGELLRRQFKINVVFTNSGCVSEYCEKHNIPCYARNANLVEILQRYDTDYFFSISNPRVLKKDVLEIPRKLTINYHDSPLPSYAGVHASSWAIIQGETNHGISWHVVETGIDTGDILRFQPVNICEDDSAFTLNLKCIEAAKSAFKTLLIDITNDRVNRQKQQAHGHSYFGLYAIPPNVGVLDFRENTDTVYNLARGLEFGNHENALGSPKVRSSSGEFFLVTNATKPDTVKKTFQTRPGTILEAIDDTLLIATGTTPIHISLAHLDGSTLSQGNFRSYGFTAGNVINNEFNVKVNDLAEVRKKETFWRRKLVRYEPTMFYRQKMNVVASIIDVSTEINVKTTNISIPDIKGSLLSENKNEIFLQACFIAFLARINCSEYVHVGLITDKKDVPSECKDLYCDITPGMFQVDNNSAISDVIARCEKEIKNHTEACTFLRDIFYRYPELRGRHPTPQHNLVLGSQKQNMDSKFLQKILQDCNVLILFNGKKSTEIVVMYHDRPAQDFDHVTDVLHHFATFLNALTDKDAGMMLKNVLMVSTNEMNQFYRVLNEEDSEVIRTETLSSLISCQCSLTPLSIAIKTTTNMLTYSKLSTEIDRLQATITKSFAKVDGAKQVIAIHAPNSVSYVISMLSIVKCGMAFLPIPIDLPADRIAFALKDANVKKLILTNKVYEKCDLNGFTPFMRQVSKHQILDDELVLVEFDMEFEDSGGEELSNSHQCDFLYLMYTSGSTGRPKGVMVKESSTINLARAQITCWDIVPGEVVAQFASIGFDASISEIFTALLSGASLAILGSSERLGNDFLLAMNKLKVSLITLPPSALNIYSPVDLPFLKKVVTAGEACTLNTAVKWTSAGDVRFFNAYGPTEATVCATIYEHLPNTQYEDVNRDLPIGKAIDGSQVYLFDDFMHPIPPDVVGELYIGGKGLSHGYIGHASEYTKQRFVQNPLTNEPSLLYKTGDHAFQDTDGNITYVGRTDDQVKIRGHRIDLSEIEQILIQHPKIELAVVVVHKCATTNDSSIAAFVAPTFIYVSELREYLSKVLPRYMLPTYIKKLEVQDLPKTINGKINRKKLQQDESVHEKLDAEGHSHLNETQLLVARYWINVFKFDESFVYSLHRQSSFSELGGNSLQLVLLLRLLEDELKMKLSFTDLGTADTIEEFAEVIQRRRDIKTKCKYNDVKSETELRELIFHDSDLDANIVPHNDRRRSVQFSHYTTVVRKPTLSKHPRNILISGVTGFLGAFLLSEILEQSTSHVCCMVRETTETRGIGRIIDNMRRYGLWKFEYSSRIAVVISDLSQKNLGIAPDIYKSLCNAIDVVFMNAAQMNFNTNYEDHRIANVQGTKEFIKFACTGVQKYIFTTSSLAVFLFPEEKVIREHDRKIFTERDFLDDPLLIAGGYGQSKWASERLVMQALEFLPGGAIFRPARISGRSTDGVGPKNDLFGSTVYGMKKMGLYPDMDFPYDLTPVDYCAKSMIEISLKICTSTGVIDEKVYHLFNRNTIPFKDLFKGMGLKGIPLEDWRNELKKLDGGHKELIPLTPFFMSTFWDKSPDWPIFDTTSTDKATSENAKGLLKPSSELLQTYKEFFGI